MPAAHSAILGQPAVAGSRSPSSEACPEEVSEHVRRIRRPRRRATCQCDAARGEPAREVIAEPKPALFRGSQYGVSVWVALLIQVWWQRHPVRAFEREVERPLSVSGASAALLRPRLSRSRPGPDPRADCLAGAAPAPQRAVCDALDWRKADSGLKEMCGTPTRMPSPLTASIECMCSPSVPLERWFSPLSPRPAQPGCSAKCGSVPSRMHSTAACPFIRCRVRRRCGARIFYGVTIFL